MNKKNYQEEPVAYAQIQTHLHEDPAEARVKTYTSVNTPIKIDSATKSTKVHGLEVQVHVIEDKNVKDDSIYEKKVKTMQTSSEYSNSSSSRSTKQMHGSPEEVPDSECCVDGKPNGKPHAGMDKADYLKNMIDNIITVLIVMGIAIGLAAVAIAILYGALYL